MYHYHIIQFSKNYFLERNNLSKLSKTFSICFIVRYSCFFLHRKEVIHPHVPVGIPCYDFTPITCPTFASPLLAVRLPTSGITDSHSVTGGVYNTRERIHPDILIQDYQRFQLHGVELQTPIRTGTDFRDLLHVTILHLFVSAIVARLQPQT